MRYFLILVGAAVVAYLLARGIAAVLSDRKRSKKRGIEMKPADLQIVKAAKPRNLAVAIGTGLLFVLILFLAFGSWFQVDQGEARRGAAQRQAGARGRARPGFQDAFHRQRVGGVGARPYLRVRELGSLQLRPAARDAARVGHVPRAGRARGGTLFRVRHHQQSAGTRAGAQDARRRQERVRPLHRRAGHPGTPEAGPGREHRRGGSHGRRAGAGGGRADRGSRLLEGLRAFDRAAHAGPGADRDHAPAEGNRRHQCRDPVVKAKAEADARRQQFTAEADGIRLRGEAEAAAIRAKAEAWPPTPIWSA